MTIKQLCEEIKSTTQLRIFYYPDGSPPIFIEQTKVREILNRWHKSFVERSFLESEIKRVKWNEEGTLVRVYI